MDIKHGRCRNKVRWCPWYILTILWSIWNTIGRIFTLTSYISTPILKRRMSTFVICNCKLNETITNPLWQSHYKCVLNEEFLSSIMILNLDSKVGISWGFFLDLWMSYEILATIFGDFWSPMLLLWFCKSRVSES